MKLISWNVNGLRACITKGFYNFLEKEMPDFFCIQESKMQKGQIVMKDLPYYVFYNDAEKKGYSGTMIFSKEQPINVFYGINDKYSDEGRLITLEFEKFYLVTVYSPNSKEELKRLDYRMVFENDLRTYLTDLKTKKSVIVCGDLNVAHEEIDIKNPKTNQRNAGFTIEERNKMTKLLDSGFIDTFRYLYPTTITYSWWSYRFNARENNAGWRIDYFLVSNDLKDNLIDSKIYTQIFGSDHCPIGLEIEI
ncbi:MAG: exodeoxyribonuclease III [Ignavibacteriales bacterium]|nr:exodeoxyribonuclease III [Ignavibacteriales bacterium]